MSTARDRTTKSHRRRGVRMDSDLSRLSKTRTGKDHRFLSWRVASSTSMHSVRAVIPCCGRPRIAFAWLGRFQWLRWLFLSSGLTAAGVALSAGAAEPLWQPGQAPIMTRWAKEVARGQVQPAYPRPQMVRSEWQSLNGLWDYSVTLRSAPQPTQYHGRILVPFPIESALSGVMSNLDEKKRVWYRRSFSVPAPWARQRVLLHFGAVDFEATVLVNVVVSTGLPEEFLMTTSALVMSAAPNGSLTVKRTNVCCPAGVVVIGEPPG